MHIGGAAHSWGGAAHSWGGAGSHTCCAADLSAASCLLRVSTSCVMQEVVASSLIQVWRCCGGTKKVNEMI
jgi:hypothetical protein